MTTNLIVRYGPSPAGRAAGRPRRAFTKYAIHPLTPKDLDFLETTPGIHGLARSIWGQITANGHGHLLIGKYSYLENIVTTPACSVSRAPAACPVRPKDYTPLFSIIRVNRPPSPTGKTYDDYIVDYRGTFGPGDAAAAPVPMGPLPAPRSVAA